MINLIVSGSCAWRQVGDRARTPHQRIQPGKDRQIGCGAERREIAGTRFTGVGRDRRAVRCGASGGRAYLSLSPVRRSNASTYLAEVFAITSLGNFGAGGV